MKFSIDVIVNCMPNQLKNPITRYILFEGDCGAAVVGFTEGPVKEQTVDFE